jgi:hypothetical protein
MAKFIKFSGTNFGTAVNFDAYVGAENIARITATATTVVITYLTSNSATDVCTITIPSDTTGTFQRELIDLILNANSFKSDGGVPYIESPATFTNGQTAANNKIALYADIALA